MVYLAQARTFLLRAKDTNDPVEKMTHLDMAAELLAKAIEEPDSPLTVSRSGLSSYEDGLLALLQDRGSRPGQPVSLPSLLSAWCAYGSEDDLTAALKGLELKGLLVADAAEKCCELTDGGRLRPWM